MPTVVNKKIDVQRPFLKWLGSKYSCINHVLEALPKANRLIEPFAGSGAVFINTDYKDYVIAEENNDLIQLFNYLQSEGDAFISLCEAYFCEENNQEDQYYRLREEFNHCTDARQRAALFVYLNRHGYNGLCRYNQQGIFNVPFGRYTQPSLPRKRMEFFHLKSQGVVFKKSDFQNTFALAKPGDLIYCDPPYAPLDQASNFSSYTDKGFGEQEQIILANLAKQAAQRGIAVVISNHDTEFTRHHYHGSKITSFPVKRVVASNIKKRVPVRELLAVFQ